MYNVELDPVAEEQTEALPSEALNGFLEMRALLELQPWSGVPLNRDNPKANMLTHDFGGAGMATYFVVEHLRLVYVVRVQWLD